MTDGITRRADVMNGAYCLAGTRMPVYVINRCMKVWSIEKMQAEYPGITREQIATALAFRSRQHQPPKEPK
jgi:uncharacterized protein (DUF433 family)